MAFQAESFGGPPGCLTILSQLPSSSVAVLIGEGVELDGVGMKMLNDCA